MTRYRLSSHILTIETGRYQEHWLPRESRICPYCTHGEVEREQHFLTSWSNYQDIRKKFHPTFVFETLCPDFKMLNKKTQLQYLLGEKQDCILLAARYIDARHKKREESTNQWHTQNFKLFTEFIELICSILFNYTWMYLFIIKNKIHICSRFKCKHYALAIHCNNCHANKAHI